MRTTHLLERVTVHTAVPYSGNSAGSAQLLLLLRQVGVQCSCSAQLPEPHGGANA